MYNTPNVILQGIFNLSEHPSDFILNVSFQNIKHVHASVQACGWPFLTSVVTRVNIRNVYKLSEYAHSLQ